jgi:hypothetical protein
MLGVIPYREFHIEEIGGGTVRRPRVPRERLVAATAQHDGIAYANCGGHG